MPGERRKKAVKHLISKAESNGAERKPVNSSRRMQTFLLLTLFYFLYLVHRGKGYGYDASAINANIDFILEGCEGNYVYNIERDYNSSEQYVSIVTINGDAKGISMECSDGTKVLSDTSQGWFMNTE